ncbi:MAG: YjgP/YjgQ family permease [Planctomycetota bacterium]|nr:MAG: YjgP/YjgQ family permease [Planctomycetota bacterium]REJ91383.1 MAG: YjgP/YjgQ family permease [Planctomycetota bacterium]REK18497.1 MAG: YjgP/YjgQ family permease [Planctomycetota bacterium]REK39443.1 MAG: YjgP/YjgQ family permease [Planctomycetota bacterium]
MALLQRSILRQLLVVFLISLTAVTLLMISVLVALAVRKEGLGYEQTFRILPYLLPEALRFSVPGTILFATCSVYGRLASANEVVAVKSLGISPWAVIWPVFAAVALLSYVAVWLNDVAVSWGHNGVRRVVLESLEELTYMRLEKQKSYTTDNLTINVRDVEARKLIEPTVTFKSGADAPEMMIRAQWARLQANIAKETLTLTFHNGHASGGTFEGRFPGTIQREIPLTDASRSEKRQPSPSHIALRDIPSQIRQQVSTIADTEEDLSAQAALAMLTGDVASLADPSWQQNAFALHNARRRLHHLKTEPHRRWANGFACLCFVVVGCPLALRMRNAEFWTVFFMCFMPILVVYYPLLMSSVDQAKSGDLPPQSVWLGNIVLLLWGGWALRKVIRY